MLPKQLATVRTFFVLRDIEIDANQDAFARHINVVESLLVEIHDEFR